MLRRRYERRFEADTCIRFFYGLGPNALRLMEV